MKVITAPDKHMFEDYSESIFLAGGITNCAAWQNAVIEKLETMLDRYLWDISELVIYNPRRDNFPMDDPSESRKQIEWEFMALEHCKIFSMYFCSGESVQPICMYELGRNILRMRDKFSGSKHGWKERVIVSVEDGYERAKDVEIQCALAGIKVNVDATPRTHAQAIAKAWADIYG